MTGHHQTHSGLGSRLAMLACGFMMSAAVAAGPPGKPFAELENRVDELETKLEETRERLDEVVPLTEALEDCVRLFEGSLGGLPGPHWIFTGCNVHVRAKNLATAAEPNGLGNLVIGYNEGRCVADTPPDEQPFPEKQLDFPRGCLTDEECGRGASCDLSGRGGSHNLVVGRQHRYTRFSGIVGGRMNDLLHREATVSGGAKNRAAGEFASISGGARNEAGGRASAVAGGTFNDAGGRFANITGGSLNDAPGFAAHVSGGVRNEASGQESVAVGGGFYGPLIVTGERGENISVDCRNLARGLRAVTVGGCGNIAGPGATTVVGGIANKADGMVSVITGGGANHVPLRAPATVVSGGERRTVEDNFDWRGGGKNSDH